MESACDTHQSDLVVCNACEEPTLHGAHISSHSSPWIAWLLQRCVTSSKGARNAEARSEEDAGQERLRRSRPVGMPRCVKVLPSRHGYLWAQACDVVHHLNHPGVVAGDDLQGRAHLTQPQAACSTRQQTVNAAAYRQMRSHATVWNFFCKGYLLIWQEAQRPSAGEQTRTREADTGTCRFTARLC